jgi:N-acetylglutamate synthase-like GNAT family acetyltransferase
MSYDTMATQYTDSYHPRFRSYKKSDEQTVAHLLQTIWGEDVGAISYYSPAENVERSDCFHRSIVAECVNRSGTTIVGLGNVSHYATHPTHVFLNFNVHPHYQHRGIGKALYQHLTSLLTEYRPHPYLTATYENQVTAVTWLQQLGFREQMQTYLPRLEVEQVDTGPLQERAARMTTYGYRISSMADLVDDPERDRKLADLLFDIYAAIHPHNPPGPAMYQRRQEIFLSNLLPEATFIAVHRGNFVAVGSLHESQRQNTLDIGTSGVSVGHQAHAVDLALVLKGHEIAFAQQHQVKNLIAEVDSTDALGMTVLTHLPFQHRPAWITFVKENI